MLNMWETRPGYHAHICDKCGHPWEHTHTTQACETIEQFDKAHTCPSCGEPDQVLKAHPEDAEAAFATKGVERLPDLSPQELVRERMYELIGVVIPLEQE